MAKLAATALMVLALLGGGFYLYQKNQSSTTIPSENTSSEQPKVNTPIPTTTIEDDLTALERDLAEINKLDSSFAEELKGL